MFIRSERLFLRPGWPEDWRDLLRGIADEQIVRNLAKVPWPYTSGHAQDYAGKAQDPHAPHFLVTLPANGEVVGSVGLGAKDDGAVELGYWIARPHWGRGYAPEAGRAVLRLARALGQKRVVAGHFVDNPASGRVLAKIGFRPTGQVRQRFSLARGHDVDSIEYAIELGNACDCDGEDHAPTRMAA